MATSEIGERLAGIRSRIERAAVSVSRDPGEITLVGAAKRQPLAVVEAAVRAGLADLGENRVQEARDRRQRLPEHLRWHLIGPLQSNKVNLALDLFDVVHSVDRVKIARRLDRRAAELDRRLPVFVEVNLGREDSKHGFLPEQLEDAAEEIAELEHLALQGLMAIPPEESDIEASRPWFQELRRLRDDVFSRSRLAGVPGHLSMGMSRDFEIAIQEGATHVRVGTSLFGPRP